MCLTIRDSLPPKANDRHIDSLSRFLTYRIEPQSHFFFSREWKSNHCGVNMWVQYCLAIFLICLWTTLTASGLFKTWSWEMETRYQGWVDQSGQERTTVSWDLESTVLLRHLGCAELFCKQLTSHRGIFYTCRQLKPPSLIPHTSENWSVLVTCAWPIFFCNPDTGHCGWPLRYWEHKSLTGQSKGTVFPSLKLLHLYLKLITQWKLTGR